MKYISVSLFCEFFLAESEPGVILFNFLSKIIERRSQVALINWNDSFSVSVTEIDLQHQKLISMINDLHDAMKARKTKEVLGEIIDGLIDYTEDHFSIEETYFAQFNYPETALHKKEHSDFVAKVKDVKKGFDEERLMLSMDIMNFLKDWLQNHINGTDKKYSQFFNSKGLK